MQNSNSHIQHSQEIFSKILLGKNPDIQSFLINGILYPLLGCSMMGAFWYNCFAGVGEYLYHANIKTAKWLRALSQIKLQSYTRFIINIMFINIILATFLCGIEFLELTRIQQNLLKGAVFQKALKKN